MEKTNIVVYSQQTGFSDFEFESPSTDYVGLIAELGFEYSDRDPVIDYVEYDVCEGLGNSKYGFKYLIVIYPSWGYSHIVATKTESDMLDLKLKYLCPRLSCTKKIKDE